MIIVILLSHLALTAQTDTRYGILEDFITMHNQGTREAIRQFVKDAYQPELYKKIDLDKHVDFYRHIIEEFGPLNPEVYEKVTEHPSKLIVYLIKREARTADEQIDPTEILVVEIDIAADDPRYLSRGLGLGALACSLRKN